MSMDCPGGGGRYWGSPALQKGNRDQADTGTEDPAASIQIIFSGPSVFSEARTAQSEAPAYRGCMRKLVLNGAPITTMASAQIQGAVGMSGCPSGTVAPDPAHSSAVSKQGKALTQRQVGSSGLWKVNPSVFPLLQH